MSHSLTSRVMQVFVSPAGKDTNPGTKEQPKATPTAALEYVRLHRKQERAVISFGGGTYRLTEPLELTSQDSGLELRAEKDKSLVLSGGRAIKAHWKPFRDGIYQTDVPLDFETDQLFVNGVKQTLARYPNFDPKAKVFGGVAADCLSPQKAASWANPKGGYIHALHANEWGDVHYRITGKDQSGKLTYEGGWQNNRQMGMKSDSVYVEGIFEELDSPGEWFLDSVRHLLFFIPPAGVNLESAVVEGTNLKSLIELKGSESDPVKDVRISGLTLQATRRTFMENREPLLRSDWTIYRGGAIYAKGTTGCTVENCYFDQVGGNAVFVSEFNRDFHVTGCRIEDAGANGVAFVGSPRAVRNPLFEYNQRLKLSDLDLQPGPKTNEYPSDCIVDNCLIVRTGRIEKQSAPIEVSMSRRITVRHCSIYDVPRAGINIGDGCWGGHLIEACDVFDTVKETGDHGSFNSWGRDRYWSLTDVDLDQLDAKGLAKLPFLDVVEPIVLRNNRLRCDHGWDIDLDDGSSNYHIIGNLCLHGGLKLREGFHRVCEDNVIVDNSFHMHVWFKDSHDVIRRNVLFEPYKVIQTSAPWGDECDFNLLHMADSKGASSAPMLSSLSGRDEHSLVANADFVNASEGDYRVRANSAAFRLGFRNIDGPSYGVTLKGLKKLARTPVLPGGGPHHDQVRSELTLDWMGCTIKTLEGIGEQSAVGLGAGGGVLFSKVPGNSQGASLGFKTLDVIRAINGQTVRNLDEFTRTIAAAKTNTPCQIAIWRKQSSQVLLVRLP